MSDLRTRRLEPADEPAFNEAFCRFIRTRYHRRPRSLEHMRWIWHGAPGGDAESWIVEAREAGQWKIVGHHGLCPIRFTCGDEDWLCAKTMRTFLMPEYRDRFLYLRFEQERLADAAQRFDALYSTAPGTLACAALSVTRISAPGSGLSAASSLSIFSPASFRASSANIPPEPAGISAAPWPP